MIILGLLVAAFAVLAALPIVSWILAPVGLGVLTRVVEGVLLAVIAWQIYEQIKPTKPAVSRVFGGPTPLTFIAVGILAMTWMDPFGWFDQLGNWLAGGGAIEGFLVRAARGLLTFAGLALFVRSIRPTASTVVRKHGRATKRSKKSEVANDSET